MMYEFAVGAVIILGIFGVMCFLADYVIPGDFFEEDGENGS